MCVAQLIRAMRTWRHPHLPLIYKWQWVWSFILNMQNLISNLGVTLVKGINQTFHNTSWRQPCNTCLTLFKKMKSISSCITYNLQINPIPGYSNKDLLTRQSSLRCHYRSNYHSQMQELVRFCAYHRIKPHTPPLVWAPVNSFEFRSCDCTPQAECLMR